MDPSSLNRHNISAIDLESGKLCHYPLDSCFKPPTSLVCRMALSHPIVNDILSTIFKLKIMVRELNGYLHCLIPWSHSYQGTGRRIPLALENFVVPLKNTRTPTSSCMAQKHCILPYHSFTSHCTPKLTLVKPASSWHNSSTRRINAVFNARIANAQQKTVGSKAICKLTGLHIWHCR